MATKTGLPQFTQYFLPTITALKQRGGSATLDELEEDVAKLMGLSDELLAIPHGGGPQTHFQYELAWVRTFLKKAEAADNRAESGRSPIAPDQLKASKDE